MAVAEARAAWQRTANRCFVQEDAKRAPKLACCPSTSAPLNKVEAAPPSEAGGEEDASVCFVPLNRNSSYSNLPPDSRWWLQLQPTYGYQRGLINEQLSTLEEEMETFRDGLASPTSKPSGVHRENEIDSTKLDDDTNCDISSDPQNRVSANCIWRDYETKQNGLKTVYSKSYQEPLADIEESCELLEMGDSVFKKSSERCLDSESPGIGAEKLEPWWRTADRDELASLVAQRSLDPLENCDLPRPQDTYLNRGLHTHLGCFDHGGTSPSSLGWKGKTCGLSDLTVQKGNLTSESACAEQLDSVEGHYSQHSSYTKTSDTAADIGTLGKLEGDPSKARLLEALCHSQTRAREAEEAAKQAYAEKEHIVKLFFKQASHLFAYKQWFQLLQLENLYLQFKNNNQHISSLFPEVLPWAPHRTRKCRKCSRKKTAKGKRGCPFYDIGKFAVAFALGLSLVGAGLLLGWTVGWMLPTF